MTELCPEKLHVVYKNAIDADKLIIPRKYTLTHSDSTGDLFLTIGSEYDFEQISGFYTRFMRDEVLAEWQRNDIGYELHLYLHVSGGFCFGWAGMRDKIFRHHLPLVLEAIKYGDKKLFAGNPDLNE
ncbi:MAG: staygreen family protein, partial [Candidatus Thorarchaeota archaeon]